MSKFKMPYNPPAMNKTVRFPNDVIEDIEILIRGKDCTFSAFVVAAVRSVVDELKEETEKEEEEKKEKEN